MSPEAATLVHPLSLAAVAARSMSFAEFELNLRDYLRALGELSTRVSVAATIADEPSFLAGRFLDGIAADDMLVECVRLIARSARVDLPRWAAMQARVTLAPSPWGGELNPAAPLEITLGIRAGRPSVSLEHKRRTNAERQRRFRARRAAEWRQLRHAAIAGRERAPSAPSTPVRPDITLDLQTLP